MAKYLTEFNTYAEYSAATLNLPNVSLIKSTGDVYYKNIYAGSVLGDILMYDVANQKLVATLNAQWDSTTYPIASYVPIAINVYPASATNDGKGRWMALRWASNSSDTGSTSNIVMKWGLNGNNITSKNQTALNGRENTDKALALADGTTANTQAAFAAFAACNRFRTSGTSAGDWYLPSKGELELYHTYYSDINDKITAIKTASSLIVNTVNAFQGTSTENSSDDAWYMWSDSNWYSSGNGARSSNYVSFRPMLAL